MYYSCNIEVQARTFGSSCWRRICYESPRNAKPPTGRYYASGQGFRWLRAKECMPIGLLLHSQCQDDDIDDPIACAIYPCHKVHPGTSLFTVDELSDLGTGTDACCNLKVDTPARVAPIKVGLRQNRGRVPSFIPDLNLSSALQFLNITSPLPHFRAQHQQGGTPFS